MKQQAVTSAKPDRLLCPAMLVLDTILALYLGRVINVGKFSHKKENHNIKKEDLRLVLDYDIKVLKAQNDAKDLKAV